MDILTAWSLDVEEETAWGTESAFLIAQIHAFQAAAALQRAMNGRAAEAEALRKAREESGRAKEGWKTVEAGLKLAETRAFSLEEEISRLKAEVA